MEKIKLGFEDFLAAVEDSNKEFVTELHEVFTSNDCKIDIKEAKSGYMVSYLLNKKTVANFVFRKSGVIVRIYGNHVREYMEFLETLPQGMIKAIIDSPICKRLVNPDACNPKCAMGYDFIMNGERYQKCRTNAFMFPLCSENNPCIKTFLCHELKACK